MNKLIALGALFFSTTLFAGQFDGTYKGASCKKEGNFYFQIEMKITSGDFDHYGDLVESKVEYLDKECEIESDRKDYKFEYTLYPTSKKDIYEFNVYKAGEEKISFYDIISKGRYKGKSYIFFGRGGPAKVESRRPVSRDINRRFSKVKED